MGKSKFYVGLTTLILVLLLASPTLAQSREGDASGERHTVQAPLAFAGACDRYSWLCANNSSEQAIGARSFEEIELLELAHKINRQVNRSVTETSDSDNYGVADYWALPRFNKGDCEDFVLQKYKLLLEAGIESRKLSIAVVLTRKGENHAVLLLRAQSSDLVLDSLSSRIVPWNQIEYRFLAMQSYDEKTRWEFVTDRSKDNTLLARR